MTDDIEEILRATLAAQVDAAPSPTDLGRAAERRRGRQRRASVGVTAAIVAGIVAAAAVLLANRPAPSLPSSHGSAGPTQGTSTVSVSFRGVGIRVPAEWAIGDPCSTSTVFVGYVQDSHGCMSRESMGRTQNSVTFSAVTPAAPTSPINDHGVVEEPLLHLPGYSWNLEILAPAQGVAMYLSTGSRSLLAQLAASAQVVTGVTALLACPLVGPPAATSAPHRELAPSAPVQGSVCRCTDGHLTSAASLRSTGSAHIAALLNGPGEQLDPRFCRNDHSDRALVSVTLMAANGATTRTRVGRDGCNQTEADDGTADRRYPLSVLDQINALAPPA